MAKLSSQFATISPGMEVDEATTGLVSVMKAFNISTDQVKSEIMDKINIVGKIIAQTYSNVWHTKCMWYLGKSVKSLFGEVETEILYEL